MTKAPAQDEIRRLLGLIQELDPLIHSVSAVNPHAIAEAETLDRETAAGHSRSPLHGQAVLVKDNVDTAGLASTAGSLALADSPPWRDATLVRRLREAGMVVLGKTNLSEWANIRDEHSTSGWSAHGGLTRNPYALNRTAWGSSSGSGAAVAARLAAYAVGTETNGSITAPAAACGLVGLKPTVGLVPTEGVVPISWSQDSPGPMARTVADAAALLDAMAGTSTADALGRATGSESRMRARPADRRTPRPVGLQPRVGRRLRARPLAAVEGRRGDRRRPRPADAEGPRRRGALTLMLVELKVGLAKYLESRDAPVRTLADVIAFNRAHADPGAAVVRPGPPGEGAGDRGPRVAGVPRERGRLHVGGPRRAGPHPRPARPRRRCVAPAMAPATPIDLVNGDPGGGGASDSSALAGSPILTVPVELAHGLPVAVSLWGARGSETALLQLGQALESGRDATTGPLPEPTFPEWV